MSDEKTGSELATRPSYDLQLREFETNLLDFLDQHKLPTKRIFVGIDERAAVFRNIESVLTRVDENHKQRSIYISKFVAAVASGLFDAALNYLWDETIFELRRRVSQYDLSYFYDNAVSSSEKRKRLKDDSDLVKIDDSELIHGAKEIELISDLGFKHLDHIRYMRNWASAAHPNQNELTGLQLISWLETCVKEVISLPLSQVVVDIKRLLTNIKSNNLSDAEAKEVAIFFINLTQDQINNLASGFFGMYTREGTSSQTRDNINKLVPLLWDRVDESTRQHFGMKYGQFVANNEQQESKLAKQFLDVVEGQSYVPDDLRIADIETAIDNLIGVHRAVNNFHNEPTFARQLQRLIGSYGNVPPQVNRYYVLTLVEVFLTNGNGVAWNAEPVYLSLLNQFDNNQAIETVLSFTNSTISSRLQFPRCKEKFLNLLELMEPKISAPVVKELIEDIQTFSGPLDKMKDDSGLKRKIKSIQRILN